MFIVAVSQSPGRRPIRDQIGVTLLAENEQQQGQEVPRHVSPRHAHHDPGPGEGWVCAIARVTCHTWQGSWRRGPSRHQQPPPAPAGLSRVHWRLRHERGVQEDF